MKLKAGPGARRGNTLRKLVASLSALKLRPSAAKAAGAKKAGWRLKLNLNTTVARERSPAPVYVLVNTQKAAACYELRADGAIAVEQDALPKAGAVIYLFEGGADDKMKADLRLELPARTSARAGKETILEEVNHSARIFRSAEYPNIMYGRDVRTLAQFGRNMVIPGPSLIDHLVAPTSDQATIIPIELKDGLGDTLAVILCTVQPGANGGATIQERLQLTKTPGVPVETLVTEFGRRAAQKIPAFMKPRVVGPTQQDLIALSTKLQFYPLENDVFGLPVSSLMRYSLAAAAVATTASIAANVVMGIEAGYLDISANKAIAERDELSRKVDETLKTRIRALAEVVSINVPETIKAAQEIWQPNALVSVDCNSSMCTLSLASAVYKASNSGSTDGAGQLVNSAQDQEAMSALLMQAAPVGYRKREVAITGDGNVVTVVFEHKNPDTPATRLLPH